MNRRRFLALCGAGAVSLTGCLGREGSGGTDGSGTDAEGGTPTPTDVHTTTDGSTTDRPTTDGSTTDKPTTVPAPNEPLAVGDYAAVGGGSAQVAEVVVQDSFVHLGSPDTKTVSGEDQYLFARVALDGGVAPPMDAYSVQVGTVETEPHEPYGPGYYQIGGTEVDPYRPEEGGGWLVVTLPESLQAPRGSLTLTVDETAVSWTLPEDALARLRQAPPEFDLRTYEVQPTSTGKVRFTLEVANVGSVPGTFRAAINQTGPGYAPVTTAAIDVGAGETETWQRTEDPFGPAQGEQHYTLAHGGGTLRRAVDFGGGTTTG